MLSNPAIFFTSKRVCCMGTATGHVTLCEDRVQFTEAAAAAGAGGGRVWSEPLEGEAAWRDALAGIFGINLLRGREQLVCRAAPVGTGGRIKALDKLV